MTNSITLCHYLFNKSKPEMEKPWVANESTLCDLVACRATFSHYNLNYSFFVWLYQSLTLFLMNFCPNLLYNIASSH